MPKKAKLVFVILVLVLAGYGMARLTELYRWDVYESGNTKGALVGFPMPAAKYWQIDGEWKPIQHYNNYGGGVSGREINTIIYSSIYIVGAGLLVTYKRSRKNNK